MFDFIIIQNLEPLGNNCYISFVRFQLRRSFISETDFCVKICFSNFLQWQQRAHCKLLYTGSRVLNVLVISIPSPYRQIFSDFRGTQVIVLSKTRGLEQMPDSRIEPELWGVSQLAGRATINYSRQSPIKIFVIRDKKLFLSTTCVQINVSWFLWSCKLNNNHNIHSYYDWLIDWLFIILFRC